MKKRYQKFVIEADEGTTFDVSEGTSGELIIRAVRKEDTKDKKEEGVSQRSDTLNGPKSEADAKDKKLAEVSQGSNTLNGQKSKAEAKDKKPAKVSQGSNTLNGSKSKAEAKDKKPEGVSQRSDTLNGPKSEAEAKDKKPEETLQNSNSLNYQNPPIPEGYKHVLGEWNNGFVIERCSDGSQFVWIPVGSLDSNGTLDGEHFSEKFGRRTYMNYEFSDEEFNEALSDELIKQIESVKKYGGFYISRYNISRNYYGKPQSVKDVMPWTKINSFDVKKVASSFENSEKIKSHLTFGAEYDSILEWIIKTGAKTRDEIEQDSTMWGNHPNVKNYPRKILETGRREEWCVNNIYDLAGNVMELTQEKKGRDCEPLTKPIYRKGMKIEKTGPAYCVMRGGAYDLSGLVFNVSHRFYTLPYHSSDHVGFRVALYIK